MVPPHLFFSALRTMSMSLYASGLRSGEEFGRAPGNIRSTCRCDCPSRVRACPRRSGTARAHSARSGVVINEIR